MCRYMMWGFSVLYLIALALLAVGTHGFFGQEKDPLAGVFLVPLGLPWNLWMDGLPEPLLPLGAILSPLINLAILVLACRYRHQRSIIENHRGGTP